MKTGKPLEVDPEDLAGKISVSYFKLIGLAKKVEVSNSPLIPYPTSERPLSFFVSSPFESETLPDMKALLVLFLFSSLKAVERPHIILVMADDQGYGDCGFTGHPYLKIPNLGAMAKASVIFDRFYAGAPVCSPTRASVMTGRNPVRVNVPNHGHYHDRTKPPSQRPSNQVATSPRILENGILARCRRKARPLQAAKASTTG